MSDIVVYSALLRHTVIVQNAVLSMFDMFCNLLVVLRTQYWHRVAAISMPARLMFLSLPNVFQEFVFFAFRAGRLCSLFADGKDCASG